MSDIVKFDGKLFQIIQRTKEAEFQVNNQTVFKHLELEVARRPPGIRALVINDNKLLLACEYRYELNGWDYRLPGGKVFDTNEEYFAKTQLGTPIIDDIIHALKRELREEVDIEVKNYTLLNISHCGLTVEWDLYYFLVDQYIDYTSTSIQKTEYEFIQNRWVDFSTALELCLNGSVSEARTAYEIIRFILNKMGGK